ncbi:sigma-70 family RNA polymerase sigma factor [Anthocerotibacter panamensis]|uniref:sigma-70 family RNA polymerase sigma factor n=1 Tax=Anthocerotibacter panamensis TaxID=2857077 RepID=UPI001C402111|nr:sigma-70 family RNA polymerase sigma factor [Anthocerotibacter panamensis]
MTLKPEQPNNAKPSAGQRPGVHVHLLQDPERSLASLYDQHGPSVYRFALKLLANPQEAEDLTQEVFLSFWQGKTYNPQRGSPERFLMLLTHSRAIDRLRRRRIHTEAIQRLRGQGPLTIASGEEPEREERRLALQQAMKQLSSLQHQCVHLFYFRGLTQAEIAQQLNTPIGTVKTRCREALIKLKKLLNDS